jgi:glycosyltransferase involved in cell wall biosynthesis
MRHGDPATKDRRKIRIDHLSFLALVVLLAASLEWDTLPILGLSLALTLLVARLFSSTTAVSVGYHLVTRSLTNAFGKTERTVPVFPEDRGRELAAFKRNFEDGQKADKHLSPLEPDVSIVMPFYNAEEYLREAIQSAQETSDLRFELVLVDDGSQDTSTLIAEQAYETSKNVSLAILDSNYGAYVARNVGVSKARGKYVAFLDSDDIQLPNRLIQQIEALRNHPTAVSSFCLGRRWDQHFTVPLSESRRVFASLVVSRALFQEVGFFDSVRWGGDAEFISRLSKYFGEAAAVEVPEELYFARWRPGSLTSANISKVFDLTAGAMRGAMSPARKKYSENFKTWHRNEQLEENLKLSFPQEKRLFALGHESQAAKHFSFENSVKTWKHWGAR